MKTSSNQNYLDKALQCFQWGYFEGSLRYCAALEVAHRRSRVQVQHIAWLSRIYLGGQRRREAIKTTREALPFALFRNQEYLAERLLVAISAGDTEKVAKGVQALLGLEKNKTAFQMWHPTAILELAEFSLNQLSDQESSIRLVNIALGYPTIYTVLNDIEKLGRLLAALNAPVALWVDWADILMRHIRMSTNRAGFLHKALGEESSVKWALREDAASESMLERTLAIAPVELYDILMRVAPALDHPEFPSVLKSRFKETGISAHTANVNRSWSDPGVLRFRYFWHDALEQRELLLLRNGEWAMFNTPTTDFSMALAQFWRLVESILKRSLGKEISSLFLANPEWIEWDRRNLTERVQKRESVFIQRLARADGWRTVTLGELLNVLQKCFASGSARNGNDAGGSRLRKEAARLVRDRVEHLGELVGERLGRVAHLTQQNIDLFRNGPSHQEPVNISDAAVGRLVARSIIDISFSPLLEARGYAPLLHIGNGEVIYAVKNRDRP